MSQDRHGKKFTSSGTNEAEAITKRNENNIPEEWEKEEEGGRGEGRRRKI